MTPVEEALGTLDDLVRAGKIRYIGCSNFSGWHLMKSLAVADRYGWPRYVAHQAYYSLIGRDYEWELMPLALDQGVGAVVWSPLGWGRLTGKIRRGQPLPEGEPPARASAETRPAGRRRVPLSASSMRSTTVAEETGKTVPQIALNWLLQRPTVSTVIIGARNEEQLRQNLGAVGWNLTPEQVAKLDAASAVTAGLSLLAPARLRRAQSRAGLMGLRKVLVHAHRGCPADAEHRHPRAGIHGSGLFSRRLFVLAAIALEHCHRLGPGVAGTALAGRQHQVGRLVHVEVVRDRRGQDVLRVGRAQEAADLLDVEHVQVREGFVDEDKAARLSSSRNSATSSSNDFITCWPPDASPSSRPIRPCGRSRSAPSGRPGRVRRPR